METEICQPILHVKVLQILPRAYPLGLSSHELCSWGCVGVLLQRASLGVSERDTEHPKQMLETRRAPGFSSQTKHGFLVFIKALQAGALLLLCNRVCLSLPESKELQLRHFPLKAIQWRGWRGGGALALTIAGTAIPAALSALIMCHTLL